MKTKLSIEVLESRQLLAGCNGVDLSAGMNDNGIPGNGLDTMDANMVIQAIQACQVLPPPYNTMCAATVVGGIVLAVGIQNPPFGPMSPTDNGCGL